MKGITKHNKAINQTLHDQQSICFSLLLINIRPAIRGIEWPRNHRTSACSWSRSAHAECRGTLHKTYYTGTDGVATYHIRILQCTTARGREVYGDLSAIRYNSLMWRCGKSVRGQNGINRHFFSVQLLIQWLSLCYYDFKIYTCVQKKKVFPFLPVVTNHTDIMLNRLTHTLICFY
jgi:hypothetical protein